MAEEQEKTPEVVETKEEKVEEGDKYQGGEIPRSSPKEKQD